MSKKVYLKVPGHFCFVEEVNRKRKPEEEKERLQALATKAINNYFRFDFTDGSKEYNYTSEQ